MGGGADVHTIVAWERYPYIAQSLSTMLRPMSFDLFLEKILFPAMLFVIPGQRWAWIYFLCGLLVALYVYWRFAERGIEGDAEATRKSGFIRFLFPREIWLHPSALTDYVYFVVNKILYVLIFVAFLVSTESIADNVAGGLTMLWGEPVGFESHWAWTILTTLIVVLVIDFALWFAHWLFHQTPWLWEFHKVHHSAEVMTPFTAARAHPVDDLFAAFCAAIAGGGAYGVLGYALGPAAQEFTMFETNIVLIAFYSAGFVLRHSHVWIAYPYWLQHIFISPAQHQIHHSVETRHWDRNMGFIFAFWD